MTVFSESAAVEILTGFSDEEANRAVRYVHCVRTQGVADTLASESQPPQIPRLRGHPMEVAMPLRRMMEGRNFEPKAAAVLVEAFNEIIDELDLRTRSDRERAARIVIELAASKPTLDVAKLRDEAGD